MDLDLLFALALLLFYLATQFLGRKKRQSQPGPQQEPTPVEAHETYGAEVDDALREIREALGWPSETQPEPEPAPPAAPPEYVRPERQQTSLESTRQPRSPSRIKIPESGGSGNDWEAARRQTARTKAELKARFGEAEGIPDLKPENREKEVHPLAKKLRSPQGARDAVIYTEIFTPRWRSDLH